MRLTVLGNADRYLAPLSGGSAYLVEADDDANTRVLLDAGGGARDALARRRVDRLDAVVLSHFHFDHTLDFVTLRDALDAGTTVLVPGGERKRLDALAEAYAFDGPFDVPATIREAEPGATHEAGPLRLSFARTQHSAPAMATRVEDTRTGRALVYASDTAPCDGLRALARDADLLLMHALLPTVEAGAHHAQVHTTAHAAAALATEVGAKRLLLSHRYHESVDAAMREAASGHPDVVLAETGGQYEV